MKVMMRKLGRISEQCRNVFINYRLLPATIHLSKHPPTQQLFLIPHKQVRWRSRHSNHFRAIIISHVKYNSYLVSQASTKSAKVLIGQGDPLCVMFRRGCLVVSICAHPLNYYITRLGRPDILNGQRIGQMINCDAWRMWIGFVGL